METSQTVLTQLSPAHACLPCWFLTKSSFIPPQRETSPSAQSIHFYPTTGISCPPAAYLTSSPFWAFLSLPAGLPLGWALLNICQTYRFPRWTQTMLNGAFAPLIFSRVLFTWGQG
ncbi:hypothetical protein KIL84_000614 [Mauremys mutica]|uniref:Uncharacterized protein n=1 Tax=Mauremys mutica TaxID=74926 RepID=A0A9D3WSX0_9SAUR|nr:hypothetical protein KIL84_000614 [Mauremys mutica]